MAGHECRQDARLDDIDGKAVRAHKELYEGREGRQPLIVRIDAVERIARFQVFVASAVLISVIVGAGAMVFRSAMQSQAAREHVGAER